MQYTGRDPVLPMGDPARAGDGGARTFSRRIDCADGGRPRPPVNPATDRRPAGDPPPRRGGRRLDID